MENRIYGFTDDYRWLSNFWEEADGSTLEHWFQASKTLDADEADAIVLCPTPGGAKRAGQKVALRPDWAEVKDEMMLRLLHAKFSDPNLRALLLATEDVPLIEANTWGDRYWGVDRGSGEGQNQLGILLMQVRDEIRFDYV